jgi:hypothetical protein
MRLALAALAAAVLALAPGAGAQSPTLFATVGPGFTINLADASGNKVTHLDPGTYTIQVDDKASIHNFHLTGPGVDQATGIEDTGTVTWTVTFAAGTYHYQCDPHALTMKGEFTVGTPSTPPQAPPRAAVKLAASVAAGKIAVTRAGARVPLVSVKAGVAVLVVSDRSALDNFRLVGPGVNRATSRAGKGTFTWKLRLKPGTYRYRSDATPTLKGSFRAV